jgi:hypothetical protein
MKSPNEKARGNGQVTTGQIGRPGKDGRKRSGFKHNMKGLRLLLIIAFKAAWIIIPRLPTIALLALKCVPHLPAIIRVARARRAVRKADEKRRRDRRWKP